MAVYDLGKKAVATPKKKKSVPTGTKKTVAKKVKVKFPGYKVPKKLLKNTKANRSAALPETYAGPSPYNPATPKAAKKKPMLTKSGDWGKGESYMDTQYGGLDQAINKLTKKQK